MSESKSQVENNMNANNAIDNFLSQYDEKVFKNVLLLREIIFKNLPGIIEQIDIPARMVGHCYGQKSSELIYTIIPSKKGLKLGFNRGTELPDPDKLLQGNGKISRYVEIKSAEQIKSGAVKNLITNALILYKQKATAGKNS